MIKIKSKAQIALMREAGRITGEAILVAAEAIREGVSTKHLDTLIRHYIEKCGAKPTFLGYGGFPASACISVNEQVIHGIPSADVILKEGDIVKIDVGATFKGYVGDSANTFGVGRISGQAQALIDGTKKSFYAGAGMFAVGNRLGDIGHAVQTTAEGFGYGVVRDYVGHGVGSEMHEDPEVRNYGLPGRGPRLTEGMTIAIEPMITLGDYHVRRLSDEWTVVTCDGSLAAHYEHTCALTENGVEFLTRVDSTL